MVAEPPAPQAETERGPLAWLRSLFRIEGRVDRRTYLWTGVGLMAFKYAVDASVCYLAIGRLWSPLDYLNPSLAVRAGDLGPYPDALDWYFALWTLPFLWIGVTMSVRRAVDAGRSGWTGLLFLVPFFNYVAMFGLALVPSAERDPREHGGAVDTSLRSMLVGIAGGVVFTLAVIWATTVSPGSYRITLFLSTPFFLGTWTAYVFNRAAPRTLGATWGIVMMALAFTALGLLLFALEGFLCVLMALPVALASALPGAVLGRELALARIVPGAYAGLVLLALPLSSLCENLASEPVEREVTTSVEIDAPPEEVWKHVIEFPALPEPEHWLLSTGIAYPVGAEMVGEGVGAVRHCRFTTGSFVEPITAWDAPRRLAFDVASQPAPMEEWSFYARVHPPHLDGTFRSTRGEFRLVALPDRRTRLEGSTWYVLEMAPHGYWRLWADTAVHRIHARVLEHIRARAQSDFSTR